MDYLLANNCLSSANKMTYEKCLILRGTWLSCSKRPYIYCVRDIGVIHAQSDLNFH